MPADEPDTLPLSHLPGAAAPGREVRRGVAQMHPTDENPGGRNLP
jgi:hypothetical protein